MTNPAILSTAPRGHSVTGIDGRVHLGTTPSPAGLIGRARECRVLDALLDAARGGQSRVLVVRGDAGIGKSALLQYLIDTASGFRVVHASGVESEMELPFAALHQVCTSLLDRLDALPEPQRDAATAAFGLTAGTSPDRLLIGLAVLTLLSAAADDGPLLCVVDDAQWLDDASTQALTFVARRLLADRVAIVFATRQPKSALDEFAELVLEPLRDGDAQTLLSAVVRVPLDERVRDRIVAETRGNPLALVEWPRGRTPAELAGGFGMSTRLPMTGQIEESFRRRVAELPPATQRLLSVAAAESTGDPIIVWRAAGALGVGPDDAAPAVDAGLLEIGLRVRFRHPLVRSVVYRSAPLADRQGAHRALAQATDPDVDPDRRAWHRALGSPGPDDDIATALEHSADRAQARGGLAAAAALLERSAALTIDPSRRGERILAAAAAHLEAGSLDVAAGLLTAAEATPLDDMGRARVELLRGRHASVGGGAPNAPALYFRAATLLEPLDIGRAEETYLMAMGSATVAGNFVRGVTIGEIARAARLRRSSEAPTTSGQILAGLAQATVDGAAAAGPALRKALEAAGIDGFAPDGVGFVGLLGFLCATASTLWDIESVRQFAARQVATCREMGALAMLPWALNTFAYAVTLEGDLESAASMMTEAGQIIEATGGDLVSYGGGAAAAWRGDSDSLRLLAKIAEHGRAAGQAQALSSALWASAMFHNSMGQYEQALAVALEADQQPWEWASHHHFHELIESAVRCAQPAVATAALERLASTVEPGGSNWGLGMYARSRALLATGGDAEDLYRDAIDHLGRSPVRPELARAHLLYGEWLRRENRRIDARAQLRTAHEMFTAMGIQGFAERTRHELLATGETVRKRTVDSFDALTPQEAHIARLAADGCTNTEIGAQLFISARTVEWHLRKVFTKLQVASRKELRAALPTQSRLTSSA